MHIVDISILSFEKTRWVGQNDPCPCYFKWMKKIENQCIPQNASEDIYTAYSDSRNIDHRSSCRLCGSKIQSRYSHLHFTLIWLLCVPKNHDQLVHSDKIITHGLVFDKLRYWKDTMCAAYCLSISPRVKIVRDNLKTQIHLLVLQACSITYLSHPLPPITDSLGFKSSATDAIPVLAEFQCLSHSLSPII